MTDVGRLVHCSAQFKDLNESLEIVPVVELGEGIRRSDEGIEWVDSVSWRRGGRPPGRNPPRPPPDKPRGRPRRHWTKRDAPAAGLIAFVAGRKRNAGSAELPIG